MVDDMLDESMGITLGQSIKRTEGTNEDTQKENVPPPDGCVDFKDWEEEVSCNLHSQGGCIHLCEVEQEWLRANLASLQPDQVAKWIKKTSKGKKKGKYPRRTHNDCIVLDKWMCNGARSSGCVAKLLLMRKTCGQLALFSKGKHDHSHCIQPTSKTKKGLPLCIREELVKYIDSDMRVPRIMQQLEKEGLCLTGITKKMVRNFLVYQRQKGTCLGSVSDITQLIEKYMYEPSKVYEKDEVYVVNCCLPEEIEAASFFQHFKVSFSCIRMVEWAKAINTMGNTKQLTIDATFKLFTDDQFILMASGVTDGKNHWFPVLYSIVPVESQATTMFHLNSLWTMLSTEAENFFEGLYILKDAGAGLHSGIEAFFREKKLKWYQQDCYAHLSRVDGNLQQACKKFGVPPNTAAVIASYIRHMSFSPSQHIKEKMLEKFETEFARLEGFMKWWKSTYGGPFKNWARCDAPKGFPVSNQGHESNNRTFKNVHMPSRSTQRRLSIHKAFKPLMEGIGSLVREKAREYTFSNELHVDVKKTVWDEVDLLLMSADWALRQEVDTCTLLPSNKFLQDVYREAQTIAKDVIQKGLFHSQVVEQEYLQECEVQVQGLLLKEAHWHLTLGSGPTDEESLSQYLERKAKWIVIDDRCTCFGFIDSGVCKHILALQVHNGSREFPQDLRILQRSRSQIMRMQYAKDLTRKQRAKLSSQQLRRKRFKQGLEELQELQAQHASNDIPTGESTSA